MGEVTNVFETSASETLVCKVEGCGKCLRTRSQSEIERKRISLGLCARHYQKQCAVASASGPQVEKCRALNGTCKLSAKEHGLCGLHYKQFSELTHLERMDEFGFDIERPTWIDEGGWAGDEESLIAAQESHEV